jgi:hypothetical protein
MMIVMVVMVMTMMVMMAAAVMVEGVRVCVRVLSLLSTR